VKNDSFKGNIVVAISASSLKVLTVVDLQEITHSRDSKGYKKKLIREERKRREEMNQRIQLLYSKERDEMLKRLAKEEEKLINEMKEKIQRREKEHIELCERLFQKLEQELFDKKPTCNTTSIGMLLKNHQ